MRKPALLSAIAFLAVTAVVTGGLLWRKLQPAAEEYESLPHLGRPAEVKSPLFTGRVVFPAEVREITRREGGFYLKFFDADHLARGPLASVPLARINPADGKFAARANIPAHEVPESGIDLLAQVVFCYGPDARKFRLVLPEVSCSSVSGRSANGYARRRFLPADRERDEIELGPVVITRNYFHAEADACLNSDRLISGSVVATPEFLAGLHPGQRLALGIYAYPDAYFDETGRAALLHAELIDPRNGPVKFIAPVPKAGVWTRYQIAFVRECGPRENAESCFRRPLPKMLSPTIKSEGLYELIPNGFRALFCGEAERTLYLHRFPPVREGDQPRVVAEPPARPFTVIEGAKL